MMMIIVDFINFNFMFAQVSSLYCSGFSRRSMGDAGWTVSILFITTSCDRSCKTLLNMNFGIIQLLCTFNFRFCEYSYSCPYTAISQFLLALLKMLLLFPFGEKQ
jgi:hypothetical protein